MSDHKKILEALTQDLIHQTDGPVTKYVVIHRAIELAKFYHLYKYEVDDIAEALADVLEDWKCDLPSNEFRNF